MLGFLGKVFEPATKLIDDLHTSQEEKLALKIKLDTIQNDMKTKILGYEQELLKSQVSILNSEASGQSWIQRNWRPITMLTFLFLVVLDCFGLLKFRLATEAWKLLQIGLGGYVVGRTCEKITPSLTDAIKTIKK